jgi:hypothetical protein
MNIGLRSAAVASLAALMAACGGGGGSGSTVSGATPTTTPVSKPFVDYKTPLIAQVAGEYTGKCKNDAGGDAEAALAIRQNGSFSLTPGGKAEVNTLRSMVTLERRRETDGGVYARFSAGIRDLDSIKPDTNVELESRLSPRFTVYMGSKFVVGCDQVAGLEPLVATPLSLRAAQFLDTKKTQLSCADSSTPLVRSNYPYEVKGGQVEVYGHSLSLLGALESESLTAVPVPEDLPQHAHLFYGARLLDGRYFGIHLNAHGELYRVDYQTGPNQMVLCTPLS